MRRLNVAAAVLIACASTALSSFASPSGVVISGFQVRGPAGGNDEYVEIRNTGSGTVDISGWKLQGCQSGSPGTASNRATVGTDIKLGAGQYYLFTNNNSSGGYSGSVTGDATYGTGFTDFASSNFAGIQLLDAANVRQDGVGSTQSPCREGTGFATPAGNGSSNAYARNQDTDNNVADFSGPQLANPHNRGPVVVACTQDGIRIFAIQGRGHVSPVNGQVVCNVPGIVTQLAANGFYMQDGDGDGDVATSDGIFVFTSSAPGVVVGQQVKVRGTVSEFRPGSSFAATNCPADSDACGLTTTEITGPTVTPASGLFANTVITPVVIGTGGRIPPNENIDGDTIGSVEVASQTTYNPAQDGIDFYESLEGMLVRINDARVVGPTTGFAEVWVVGDNGANASGVNARGGVTLIDHGSRVDFNPERILVDVGGLGPTPLLNVGDRAAQVTGAMSYGFGSFRVNAGSMPAFTSGGLTRGTSTVANGPERLRIASYNVENLDANDADTCDGGPDRDVADGRFTREAQQIAGALGSPDILGIEELQDNSGCANNGVVESTLTLDTLTQAIVAAGGPAYSYVLVNPVNNADGGAPGANIRQAILYNAARVTFVPGTNGAGNATTATALSLDSAGRVQLTLSPGRIDPANAAWNNSRKPLAATFDFRGQRLLVIVNHFNSKGGDEPLFGRFQPPVPQTETQRIVQARVEHDFIAQALALDANAAVVSLGDFNDFEFSAPMRTLTGAATGRAILTDLASLLPPEERYSYVFEGNSQELDHIYVTSALLDGAQFQPVHVNAEFADQVSDHDPMIASLLMPDRIAPATSVAQAPAPNAQGYNRGNVTLTFSAVDDLYGRGVDSIHYSMTGAQTDSGTVPSGGSIVVSSEGQTAVSYFATDLAGNAEAPRSLTVKIDNTAPVISAPASLSVDATGPQGAVVTYAVTATDDSGLAQTVTCTPASGSTFAIGIQAVGCTATDSVGNTAESSFNVTVRGTPEQLAQLTADVAALAAAGIQPAALNGLTTALGQIAGGASGNAFCVVLSNFAREAGKLGDRGVIPAIQAGALAASANRIRAVQGCVK